jgi:hypothetical protein
VNQGWKETIVREKKGLVLRVLSELIVIVVGVLIAFQVESWRDSVESRRREQAQLMALVADFNENVARLRDAEAFQSRSLRAYRQVLAIGTGDVPMPPPDSAYTLFRRVRQFARFEPVTGAYDAMVSSGDLRLLQSQELRAHLAAFVGAAGDGYEDEGLADLLRAEFTLLGARVIPMGRMTQGFVTVESFGDDESQYDGQDPQIDFEPLFADQTYLGLAVELGEIENRVLRYFEDLHTRADRILEIIGAELS